MSHGPEVLTALTALEGDPNFEWWCEHECPIDGIATPEDLVGPVNVIERMRWRRAEQVRLWLDLDPLDRDQVAAERKREEKFAAEAERMRSEEMRHRRIEVFAGRVPVEFKSAEIRSEEVAMWVKRLLEDDLPGPRRGLMLVGPTGRGKSGEMWAAGRALLGHGWPGQILIRDSASMLAEIDQAHFSGDRSTLERFKTCDLLMIDDLGVEERNDRNHKNLFRVLDARYRDRRPTVVATNVAYSELRKAVGDRIAGRLQYMCEAVAFIGPDLRKVDLP